MKTCKNCGKPWIPYKGKCLYCGADMSDAPETTETVDMPDRRILRPNILYRDAPMSNFEIMTDTKKQYESNPELIEAVRNSIKRQYMVSHEENIDQPAAVLSNTMYVCSGKRSFEAAKVYQGQKTVVLNFANNRYIGGNPFYANAQEEALCRCSTLLPCLEAMRDPFYNKHKMQIRNGEMSFIGNDDLIYTPDVVVFKTDDRTEPPQMMDPGEWYKVDVITSAAPEMFRSEGFPREDYVNIITSRIKKILDVAAKEKNEVLILGKWGCGAFMNDPKVVSSAFYSQLKNYSFDTVEFALATNDDVSYSVFAPKTKS